MLGDDGVPVIARGGVVTLEQDRAIIERATRRADGRADIDADMHAPPAIAEELARVDRALLVVPPDAVRRSGAPERFAAAFEVEDFVLLRQIDDRMKPEAREVDRSPRRIHSTSGARG